MNASSFRRGSVTMDHSIYRARCACRSDGGRDACDYHQWRLWSILAQRAYGRYEARLNPSWWPNHLLERVLIAYAQRHGIASVRAFVSATGPYVSILKHARWRDAGISDVLVLTPEAEPGGMRRSPATQGEALVALRDGTLSPEWRSSYGLGLDAHSV